MERVSALLHCLTVRLLHFTFLLRVTVAAQPLMHLHSGMILRAFASPVMFAVLELLSLLLGAIAAHAALTLLLILIAVTFTLSVVRVCLCAFSLLSI